MFKIGDKAVYPAQGLVEIESIESREISGTKSDFYILRIVNTDMTIILPVANVESVGMRDVVDSSQIAEMMDLFRDEYHLDGPLPSWSRRQKIYQDKIRSGNLKEVALVLRELCFLKENKDLSYGEKKYLEQARKLVIQELAYAHGCPEEDMATEMESLMAHS